MQRPVYQIIVTNYQGFVLRTYVADTRAEAEKAAAELRKLNVRHMGRVEVIAPASNLPVG